MYGPKAIETVYNGYRFRSRIEARWAVFFDALGVEWEYEKEGFDLGDGLKYLPDFWLPTHECWIEVKGEKPKRDSESYLKIERMRELSRHPVYVVWGQIGNHRWDEMSYGDALDVPMQIKDLGAAINKMMGTVTEYDNSGDHQMCCPICGFDYFHFDPPRYIESDDRYGSAWNGRGDALKIPCWCENGHKFNLRFGFHKGNTYFNIEDVTEEKNGVCCWLAQSADRYEKAITAAKSARFEYGENGTPFRKVINNNDASHNKPMSPAERTRAAFEEIEELLELSDEQDEQE